MEDPTRVLRPLADAADSCVYVMEQVTAHNDVFGPSTFSFGPKTRQGSNESFLVRIRGGQWCR